MNVKCEWCGRESEDLPEAPADVRAGFGDPFKAGARRFRACPGSCQGAADRYYRNYDRHIRLWFGLQISLVLAAFVVSIPDGLAIFRWVMPAVLLICGAALMAFPYANRFSRDKSGFLRTSLKRSILDARLTGAALSILSIFFLYRNFLVPALF